MADTVDAKDPIKAKVAIARLISILQQETVKHLPPYSEIKAKDHQIRNANDIIDNS